MGRLELCLRLARCVVRNERNNSGTCGLGGPTWKGVYVDSPVIVNASAGEFYKQPTYFALGHFSKFLSPGLYQLNDRITLTVGMLQDLFKLVTTSQP